MAGSSYHFTPDHILPKKGRFVIANDITARKWAEEALRRSEEKYRDLFENANDAIFIVDADLHCVDENKKVVELLGYSKA